MPPFNAAGMAIEQQTADLHHPIDPFVIRRLAPGGQGPALAVSTAL